MDVERQSNAAAGLPRAGAQVRGAARVHARRSDAGAGRFAEPQPDVANSCTALGRRLAGSGKRVFDASLRVCLDVETSIYVYPDLTVVEGAVQTLEDADETVTNPKVVFEVLSPATRGMELGDKARMYVRVASLTDLVIIDQDRVLVEHWDEERRTTGTYRRCATGQGSCG